MISGPSGVGKGTLIAKLRERRPDLVLSVSATTRPRRAGERDGADYHFLDDAAFDTLVDRDGLLEWAHFAGHRYGTLRAPVRAALEEGRMVLLEIDVQGARQIRDRAPDAALVFIAPPSLGELEARLRGRGTDSAEAITARLERARRELAAAAEFDHVVVNSAVDSAVDELVRILDGSAAC